MDTYNHMNEWLNKILAEGSTAMFTAGGIEIWEAPDQPLDDDDDPGLGETWDSDRYDAGWNAIEQGMYDDDPDPYGGTYSEE